MVIDGPGLHSPYKPGPFTVTRGYSFVSDAEISVFLVRTRHSYRTGFGDGTVSSA